MSKQSTESGKALKLGPYHDLRTMIAAFEEAGELQRITAKVHWKEELSAIVRRTMDVHGDAAPALLFTNITDYAPPGPSKVISGTFRAFSRVAMMMGLPRRGDYPRKLVKEIRERNRRPVKPVLKSTGPIKENKDTGDKIDVTKFPVPLWHSRDGTARLAEGGRYIGTLASAITKDPDTGWVNVGNYRSVIHDKNTLGLLLRPGWQHIGLHYQKYIERNEPMPISLSIGGPPLLTMMGPTPVPTGVSEYDVAGAYGQAPVEVVKSETSDIPVPANAEIVIEGTIDPQKRMMEGPFGEYPGYYGSWPTPKPVVDVKCVTYRNDPIYIGSLEGYSINESSTINCLGAAQAWDVLEDAGVPGVRDVAITRTSGGSGHTIVSIKPLAENISTIIGSALWGSHESLWRHKHVFVVDEDIDPWNLEQVDWAVWSRVKASEDVWIFERTRGSPLDPRMAPEEKGFWDRLLVDATRPFHWQPRPEWATDGVNKGIPLKFPPISRPSPATMELVQKKWDEYGIKPMKEFVGSDRGTFANWWTPEFIEGLKTLKITR